MAVPRSIFVKADCCVINHEEMSNDKIIRSVHGFDLSNSEDATTEYAFILTKTLHNESL